MAESTQISALCIFRGEAKPRLRVVESIRFFSLIFSAFFSAPLRLCGEDRQLLEFKTDVGQHPRLDSGYIAFELHHCLIAFHFADDPG